MAASTDDEDSVASFVLDGATFFVRWHPDEWAMDAVVPTDFGQWAFSELAACLAAWPDWTPDAADTRPADYDMVTHWLADGTLEVPAEDLLSVWNLTGDVARGLGVPWDDRGLLRDQVFDKLTFASIPWLVGREVVVPHWSPRELVAARRVAAEAV